MERHFKEFVVLKNIYARSSIYIGKPLAVEQEIIRVEILGDIYKWKDYRFHISWLQEWERLGLIEEVLPDKKPISSEENTNIEEDIYSRKYNIYEILTLIPNIPKDSKFKCSLNEGVNEYWSIDQSENTLRYFNVMTKEMSFKIEECYELKQLLEATYTIVKPIEEVEEKWIRIETHKDLCSAIAKKKMIRVENGTSTNDFTDEKIQALFNLMSYKFGKCKIEYLEEN